MMHTSQRCALLIAGPTASGKSALALRLARERRGIIINADAMQVYRELRILTARPDAGEEAAAPHRLYGHVPVAVAHSVATWLHEAERELGAAWAEGFLPIVTGGTGLYFRALEQGLAAVPPIPDEVRLRWRSFAGDLHAELLRRDPAMAARLLPADRQRLVRALEVVEATGRSLGDWQREGAAEAPLKGVEVERMFLDVPRPELYARAETRFEWMLSKGAIAEARQLIGLDPALPALRAIGVRELLAHLRGEASLEQATAAAKQATRRYIKRQLTWWRGQMAHWQSGPQHDKIKTIY
jgi:tRNA dimethylallyltransferase